MSAPHLPPKTCDINTHRRIQTLPWFLAVIFLAMIAGGSAAIMATTWLVPTLFQDTSLYIRNRGQEGNKSDDMDLVLRHQLAERTATVFDTRRAIAPDIYNDSAVLGTLAMLSSDGWGAMSLSAYQPGEEKKWRVVNDNGAVFPIEKAVYDKEAKLLYVKLTGQSFSVFSFLDWSAVEPNSSEWVWWQNRAQKKVLEDSDTRDLNEPYHPEDQFHPYQVKGMQTESGLVISESGQLIGLLGKDGIVMPNYVIRAALPQVLSQGKLRNAMLPFVGLFVTKRLSEKTEESISGFYVSTMTAAIPRKTLEVGDIILRIDGQSFTPTTLSPIIFATGDMVTLDVLRNGVVVENVVVKKEMQE